MKRALPLLVLGSALSANAVAGPQVIGSVYMPDVEVENVDASPDALTVDVRFPLNKTFWVGGTLATSLSEDAVAPGVDVEVGTSFTVNLGVQAEFAHRVYGYGYVGYGSAGVESNTFTDIDGKGLAWGLGMQFGIGDNLLVDAGYATLFDGDMEDDTGTDLSTTIAGPRVGLGFTF